MSGFDIADGAKAGRLPAHPAGISSMVRDVSKT